MKLRNLLIAASGLSVTIAAGAASAETPWNYTHPARTEVNHRRTNLYRQIAEERRAGDISRLQDKRLQVGVNQVRYHERVFARHHGGHLNAYEDRQLNRQENIVHKHIAG
jgi:hypothetical protein